MNPSFLIIDSDEDFAVLLKASFDFYGVDTFIASDASEGLKIAREKQPQAILTKLDLPGGTNGAQFTALLRKEQHIGTTPILLLTEPTDDEEFLKIAQENGINGQLPRTASETDILNQIKQIAGLSLKKDPPPADVKKNDRQSVNAVIGFSSRDTTCCEDIKKIDTAQFVSGKTSFLWQQIRRKKIDLLLIDLYKNETKSYELIDKTINHPAFKTIPIIMLYSETDNPSFVRLIKKKADKSYLKPFNADLLKSELNRIETLKKKKAAEAVSEETDNSVIYDDDEMPQEKLLDYGEGYEQALAELDEVAANSYLKEIIRKVNPRETKSLAQDLAIYTSTADDALKEAARSRLVTTFWILYRHILNHPTELLSSIPKRLLIRFGILDKALLTEDYFQTFSQNGAINKKTEDIPIYYADEWLTAIRDDKITPSSSKLGATPDVNAKLEDHEMDRVVGKELRSLRIMTKIMMGRYGSPFPILETFRIKSLKNNVIFKQKAQQIINKVDKSLDPGAFDRTYQNNISHIIPNFVILPVTGVKGLCWEPYEAMDRANSRGRIVLPLLTMRDAEEMIIKAIGDYRWETELSSSLRYWEHDTIVTAYYKMYRKKTRFDVKQRFLDDYYIWITKESSGRAILSKETRLLLWHYTPFSIPIKQTLIKSDTYKDLVNKRPVF